MYHTSSELYNVLLEKYIDQHNDLLDAKCSKIKPKYDPTNLSLDECEYDKWYK